MRLVIFYCVLIVPAVVHSSAGAPAAAGSAPASPAEPRLLDQAFNLLSAVRSWTHTTYAGVAAGGAEDPKAGGKAAKGKKDDKKGALPPPAAEPAAEAAAPVDKANMTPEQKLVEVQKAEAISRALGLMAKLEQLRWKPIQGVPHVVSALQMIRDGVEFLDGNLGTNDDLERLVLDPLTWLNARTPMIALCQQLGHFKACLQNIELALQECAAVNDSHVTVQLLHMRAVILSAQGKAVEALNTYHDAVTRARKLTLLPDYLGTLLLEFASLQWDMGLLDDACRNFEEAQRCLAQAVRALGLHEMQEYTERHNIYIPTVQVSARKL